MSAPKDLVAAHLNALNQTLGAVEAQIASVKNVIAILQNGQGSAGPVNVAPEKEADPFGSFGGESQPAQPEADAFGEFGEAEAPDAPDPKEELNAALKSAANFVLKKAAGKKTGPESRKAVTDAVTKKFGVKTMKSLPVEKYSEVIAFLKAAMK